LLDLNLPGLDGRKLLEKIKSEEKFRKIPVVVLTTSDFEEDIEQAYDSGANSYIVKPTSRDRFLDVIETLETYWFQVVELPKNRDS
jgi:CheY-like chemotaxis protein